MIVECLGGAGSHFFQKLVLCPFTKPQCAVTLLGNQARQIKFEVINTCYSVLGNMLAAKNYLQKISSVNWTDKIRLIRKNYSFCSDLKRNIVTVGFFGCYTAGTFTSESFLMYQHQVYKWCLVPWHLLSVISCFITGFEMSLVCYAMDHFHSWDASDVPHRSQMSFPFWIILIIW